jgi:hypothetical protein
MDSFVAQSLDSAQIDAVALRKLWEALTVGTAAYQGSAFDLTSQSLAAQMAEEASGHTPLEFGAGAWTIDLKSALAGGFLQGSLLAGILWANGLDGIPAAVASVVIPAVISLESVKLTPGEEVRFQLVRDGLSPQKGRSAESVYKRLPEKVRKQLSLADLADFLDRLYAAGLVDRQGKKYVDRGDHPAWLRISLR